MADLSFSGRFPIHLDLPNGVYQVFEKTQNSLNEAASKAANTVTKATGQAVETITETADRTKTSLSETANNTINTFTEATSKTAGNTVNTIVEITDQTNNSLAETANKTANIVTDATNKTFSTVAETAQQTKISVTETAGNVVNAANEATTQMLSNLEKKGENGRAFLGDTLQTAENLNNSISTKLENAISTVINHQIDAVKVWIEAHPALSWATKALLWGVNHPIFSLIILVVSIFILIQFIKASGRFVEQVFLSTLKAPFKFGQFLFSLRHKSLSKLRDTEFKSKQHEDKVLALNPSISSSISHEHKERLVKILARMDAIKQEQNELLQEITAILALDDLRPE